VWVLEKYIPKVTIDDIRLEHGYLKLSYLTPNLFSFRRRICVFYSYIFLAHLVWRVFTFTFTRKIRWNKNAFHLPNSVRRFRLTCLSHAIPCIIRRSYLYIIIPIGRLPLVSHYAIFVPRT